MAHVAPPPLTADDYRAMPETGPRYQLIEGDLYMAPAPNRYHQDISRNIEYILLRYLETHPIGKIYDAPFDVYIDDLNVYQPDILFVSNQRLGILTPAGAEGAPDFIVEILSPRTARLDRDQKRKTFARAGVIELWIVVPDSRTIEIHRLQEDSAGPVAIHGEDSTFESALFPSLSFRGAEIFAA